MGVAVAVRAVHKRNLIESIDPLLLSASSSEAAAPWRAVVEVVTRLIACLDKLQVVAVETGSPIAKKQLAKQRKVAL